MPVLGFEADAGARLLDLRHLDIGSHAAASRKEMAPEAGDKAHRICLAVAMRKNGAGLVHAGQVVKVLATDEFRSQPQFLPGRSFALKLIDPKNIARQVNCRPLCKATADLQGFNAFPQCVNRLSRPPPGAGGIGLANLP